MQIKALKVFCDVVTHRSFSKAAEENGLTQSGASQVVHQLEQELGVRLLDRSRRPLVLTPEGDLYYEGCRHLVEQYFALEERVKALHEDVEGRVRLAAIYSVGLHHISRCIDAFQEKYPKADVRVEYRHPQKVYDEVEQDQADLGLVSYPKASRTIEAIPWRDERMVLVCAPSNPLARRTAVRLEDLADVPVIHFDQGLPIRRNLDQAFQAADVTVRVILEFDNIETIKRAVEIDEGVALLPEPTIAREVAAGTLVAMPITGSDLVRPLGIIHRRGKELGATAQRFMEFLQQEAMTEQALSLAEGNGRHDAHAAAPARAVAP